MRDSYINLPFTVTWKWSGCDKNVVCHLHSSLCQLVSGLACFTSKIFCLCQLWTLTFMYSSSFPQNPCRERPLKQTCLATFCTNDWNPLLYCDFYAGPETFLPPVILFLRVSGSEFFTPSFQSLRSDPNSWFEGSVFIGCIHTEKSASKAAVLSCRCSWTTIPIQWPLNDIQNV